MIRYVLLVLAMCAAVLSPVTPVQAASTLSILNKIIMNTPGISSVSVGGSTTVSGAAAESVGLSSGLRIPVPISATASIGSSALADIAATAMKGGLAVGLAAIAVPMIIDAAGIYVCPPPAFFCKPDPNGPNPSDIQGHYTWAGPAGYPCTTSAQNCDYLQAAKAACSSTGTVYTTGVSSPNPSYDSYYKAYVFTFSCTNGGVLTSVKSLVQTTCPSGYHLSGGQCVKDGSVVPGVPATVSDISGALAPKMASSGAKQQAIYDAVRADGIPVFTGAESVTVTAPPVTTQPQTRTEYLDNGDGTTSTKTITTQTTVTPQVSGNTINNTNITYPAQTTVTTTITNNVTNVTTTTTTIINENATPQTQSEKVELPTDYARDAAVRQLDRDLNADGAPALPDQEGRITAKGTEVETAMQAKRDAIVAGKSDDQNLFYKWLWTPPVGSCSATTGTVHGWTVGFDICPTVEMIRDCLGWLQALFTAITVYGLLFRQGD